MGSAPSRTGREDSRPPSRPPSPPPLRPPWRPPMEVAKEARAKGNAAFSSGKFTEAIKFFTEAIDLDPSNHLLYSNRCDCYASLNQHDKALEDAKKTVELKSDWAIGYGRLGAAYVRLGSFQDAIASFKKSLKIDPGNEALKLGLAHAQWCSCSFSPSELLAKLSADPTTRGYLQQPDFVKMIQTKPSCLCFKDQRMMNALGVLLNLPSAKEAKAKGNAAFFSGNFTEAIKFFSEAIDLAPSDHLLYSNRSACYASLNQHDKALEDAKKTVELKSDWAKGYSRLGAAYAGLRSFQDAIASYKKGLKIDPGNEGLKSGLAHAQRMMVLDLDECMVLEGDPDKPLQVANDFVTTGEEEEEEEVLVVAEKGQIACRDYPHARHLCVTFPFNTNPHEKYCALCHCYVCDILVPCVYWGTGKSSDDHCHSTDKEEIWRELRHRSKEGKLAQPQVSDLLETTLSNEPLRHQALNCSQPLNVNEETQLQVSGLLETTLSNEPLRHQALNCSQPLNVNEERVVQLDLMSLALDRSTVQGDKLTGIVKWFDSQKGYGFISPEDGGENLFVHHSSIKSKEHQSLAEGERVEFEIEIDDRGRRKATNVSGPGGSFVQGTSGRDNRGINFSMRGGRGPGDRIYGGRASTSRRGYGRNKDAGANNLGGSIFQGITRKDNYGNSDSDNDASKCVKCGEMGHLARNCNGIGGGIGNNFRVRVDRGGGRKDYGSRASVSYRGGDSGRNRAAEVSSPGGSFLQETTSSNRESDTPKCYNCGEIGHLMRNCDGGGGNGLNGTDHRVRVDRGGGRTSAYRRGDLGRNKAVGVSSQRGGCDSGTNSGRGGSFELSNSRYNERNRAVSMRRPNGNLPRGNTRRGNHYGEIGNSTRDRPSTERGGGGCYICGKLGHQGDCYKERDGGLSEDGVSSCTCGEAEHLPDCPKKQDSVIGGVEVTCESGHL